MITKNNLMLFFLMHIFSFSFASGYEIPEIYPTNWWIGMKNPKLQLMLHAVNIADNNISINYPGVKLVKVNKAENKNYVFLDLIINAEAKPGKIKIHFESEGGDGDILYELKPRRKGNGSQYAKGITSSDLIYLMIPDRFSNGDVSNDKFADMHDTSSNRKNPFLRHGGDLQGIINHLDYFNEIGATSLWLTPVVENDQSLTNENGTMRSSYHGYAFTNQYKIDKRFGGNDAYKKMIDAAHAKGLKVIQDAVYNHVGDKHFLFVDQPSKDFFNQWSSFTGTSYRDEPLIDPYASKSDRDIAEKGWFTSFLPDLNQRNLYVANYLIQYAIWAVEEFGIDGWRVDTYFYSDKDFLNKINQALYNEFPRITIFGETTMHSVTEQAYYMQNNINTKWKSNLQGVIDFQWENSVLAGLNEKSKPGNGFENVYDMLVQDILYKDPMRNELLLDNHDQDRFFSVIGEDFDKYKMGIVLLLTQRGIPQLYYGTEILMKNFKDPTDAEVRKDFPGGWKEDSINKFISSGRTEKENEAFDFVKKLSWFRKNSSALQSGTTMQFLPLKGVYVYFRYDAKQTVMVILNTNDKETTLMANRFNEITKGFSKTKNVITGNISNLGDFKLAPKESVVLELMK